VTVSRDEAPETKYARLLDDLGAYIATGTHHDQPLDIEAVVPHFTGSRTVIREVTQVLQSKGLVSVRQRQGIRVQPMSKWALYDPQVIKWRLRASYRSQIDSLTQLRKCVEPVAAELATTYATAQQRGELLGFAEQLEEVGSTDNYDEDRYLELDKRFHGTLVAASGNEMFAALEEPINHVLGFRMGPEGNFPRRPKPIAMRLHIAVATAISRKEPWPARICMEAIVAEVQGAIGEDLVAHVSRAFEIIGFDTKENRALLHKAKKDPHVPDDRDLPRYIAPAPTVRHEPTKIDRTQPAPR
jgi:DNA-binding FadR family transcriptional regulator